MRFFVFLCLFSCQSDIGVCEVEADCTDADEDGFWSTSCDSLLDQYPLAELDCDDNAVDVNNFAIESCDGKDNDCDGLTDEDFDYDGDNYVDALQRRGNYAADDLDCDDGDSTVNPLVTESNDGVDNNCDGRIDEDFDGDGDGYSSATGDCDNSDPDVNPGAQELCGSDGAGDGLDNNCNNEADEGCS